MTAMPVRRGTEKKPKKAEKCSLRPIRALKRRRLKNKKTGGLDLHKSHKNEGERERGEGGRSLKE